MTRIEWLGTLSKGSIGAEIGVAAASYSLQMLNIVKPKKLYLVDRWSLIKNKGAVAKKERQMHVAMSKLAPYVAKDIALPICAFSADAAKWIPNGTLDWVYIDASHKPEDVYTDMKAWYPKVRSMGIIAGHDYKEGLGPYEGVNKAIKEICPSHEAIKVVDEDTRTPSFWFRRS